MITYFDFNDFVLFLFVMLFLLIICIFRSLLKV